MERERESDVPEARDDQGQRGGTRDPAAADHVQVVVRTLDSGTHVVEMSDDVCSIMLLYAMVEWMYAVEEMGWGWGC